MKYVDTLESRRMFSGYDLFLSSLTTDVSTVAAGKTVVGTAVVTNLGTDASPGTTTVYYALTKEDATETGEGGGPGGGGGGGGGDGPGIVGKVGFVQIGAVGPGQTVTVNLVLGVATSLPASNLFFSAVASELFLPNITPTTEVEFGANDTNDGNNSRSRAGTIAVVRPAPTVGTGDAGFGSGGTAQNTVQGAPLTVAGTVFDPATSRQYAATTRIINDKPVLGLLRFKADGSLDTEYGNGGLQLLPPGSPFAQARAISWLADGKILVVGETRLKDQVLARFERSGEPDGTFGQNGAVVLRAEVFARFGDFQVVRVMPGAGGTTTVVANTSNPGQPKQIAVARFRGPELDTTFGNGGFVVLTRPTSDSARAAMVMGDGRMVIAGLSKTPPSSGGVTRAFVAVLTSAGVLDGTFGTNGVYVLPPESSFESFTSVAVGPTGSIFATGVRRVQATSSSVVLTVKLSGVGKPEKFGKNGVVATAVPSAAVSGGATVLATSDGGALVSVRTAASPSAATSGQTGAALLRLKGDGTVLSTFGSNGLLTIRATPGATAEDADSSFESFASSSEGEVEDVGGGKVRFLATDTSDSSSTTFTSTQLLADGIDLSATSTTSVRGSVLIGKAGTIKVTLSNQGTLTATGKYPVTVSLYGDLDSAGLTATATTQSIKLAPGASRTVTVKYKFPSVPEVARYFVAADVSMPAGVTDVDTSNNRAAADGVLTVGPAFTRLGFSLVGGTPAVAAGANASIRLMATNGGNVIAKGAGVATLLLSDDASGSNAVEIVTLNVKASLSHLKSTVLTLKGKLPSTLEGVTGKYLVVRFSGALVSLNDGEGPFEVVSGTALG